MNEITVADSFVNDEREREREMKKKKLMWKYFFFLSKMECLPFSEFGFP